MPFIKISNTVYINSDAVQHVTFYPNGFADLFLLTKQNIRCSAEAATNFLMQVEARADFEPGYKPEALPLKSRVAIALREDYPQGATLLTLDAHFIGASDKAEQPREDLGQALAELLDESTVITSDTEPTIFYHASHTPQVFKPGPLFTPSPDPSVASEDSNSVLPDNSERS